MKCEFTKNFEFKKNQMMKRSILCNFFTRINEWKHEKKMSFKMGFSEKSRNYNSKKINIFYIFLIIKIRNGNINSNLRKYLKKNFQMFEIDFNPFRAIFYKGDIDECK